MTKPNRVNSSNSLPKPYIFLHSEVNIHIHMIAQISDLSNVTACATFNQKNTTTATTTEPGQTTDVPQFTFQ